MSVTYVIEGNALHFAFEGATLSHDVFETFHRAYQDPACPVGADLLIDCLGSLSLSGRSIEGVRTLSEFVVRHPGRPGQRMALILPVDTHERYATLMQEMEGRAELTIRMFGSVDEGRAWLAGSGDAQASSSAGE